MSINPPSPQWVSLIHHFNFDVVAPRRHRFVFTKLRAFEVWKVVETCVNMFWNGVYIYIYLSYIYIHLDLPYLKICESVVNITKDSKGNPFGDLDWKSNKFRSEDG